MRLRIKSPTLFKALAAAMFIAFAAAGLRLLFLAFEIGDVYPPYSSHRAELDGAEVFYEALERLPELQVARHYGPAAAAAASNDVTIIVPGYSTADWYFGDEDELKGLLRLADRGGRLVLTLQPAASLLPLLRQKEKEQAQKGKKKPVQPVAEKLLEVAVKLEARPQLTASQGRMVKQAFIRLVDRGERLPERLPWPAPGYLEPQHPGWKTIYAWTGRPALLRRPYGKGEIVLLADSFLLSNRAMWEARHPEFLIWLIGGRGRVLFYERHLGVAENPGVAWLIRRYKLDGVVASLLILVALLVWRNSVPLIPVGRTGEAAGSVRTVTRGSSLLALVSRSVPSSEILPVCVEEWKRSERPSRHVFEPIEKLAREKGDILAIYRQIVQQLRASSPRGFETNRRPRQTAHPSAAGADLRQEMNA
ncbi:MAG: DUF4350 domain-containing protein [Acidobacteriota bacterium]